MDVLWVAAIGVAFVLITVLVLRLHPVIGLLISSLFVLSATPRSVLLTNELSPLAIEVIEVDNQHGISLPSVDARAGSYYLLDELQTNPAARSFQLSVASDQAVANSSASGTWFTPDAQAPILLPDESSFQPNQRKPLNANDGTTSAKNSQVALPRRFAS